MTMLRPLRPLLRQAAYRSGVLSFARNGVRHALTAVMFHRVVDPADPDYAQADPVYTVSAPVFDQLLGFFSNHYNVVDIRQVLDAADGTRRLPDHALLITFDDGWADNIRYAAPLLQAHAMPAIIFVAAQAVQATSQAWWQEQVYALMRAGRLKDWLTQYGNPVADVVNDHHVDIVTRIAMLDAADRDSLLAGLPHVPCHARMMMTPDEVRRLGDFGVAVGLHGDRHVPLTSLPDPREELANACDAMVYMTGGEAAMQTLGCPHGRYDSKVIAAARDVGIRLVFTSDKLLNATEDGMLTRARPLGRLGIDEELISAAPYHLDPAAAARWLWPRECR